MRTEKPAASRRSGRQSYTIVKSVVAAAGLRHSHGPGKSVRPAVVKSTMARERTTALHDAVAILELPCGSRSVWSAARLPPLFFADPHSVGPGLRFVVRRGAKAALKRRTLPPTRDWRDGEAARIHLQRLGKYKLLCI